MRKFYKAQRDPIGFLCDSRFGLLRFLGTTLQKNRVSRFRQAANAAADMPIGVIMTAYNTGDLLERAALSVLQQSHKALELWIIDDASSDDTPDVIKKLMYRDERVKGFRSKKNHGTYWSKNWCLHHIKTPLVTFHDSDDVSLPDRLKQQLGAMLVNKKLVGTTARWKRVNADGQAVRIDGRYERTAAITLMVWRERALQSLGYFDTVRISADTEYLSRIRHKLGRRALYDGREVLYEGLIREASLTRGERSGFDWTGDTTDQRRQLTGDRLSYHESFKAWHRGEAGFTKLQRIEYPQVERPFTAPQSLLRDCSDQDLDSVERL